MSANPAALAVGDKVFALGDHVLAGRVTRADCRALGPWYAHRAEVSWGIGWRNYPLTTELRRVA